MTENSPSFAIIALLLLLVAGLTLMNMTDACGQTAAFVNPPGDDLAIGYVGDKLVVLDVADGFAVGTWGEETVAIENFRQRRPLLGPDADNPAWSLQPDTFHEIVDSDHLFNEFSGGIDNGF